MLYLDANASEPLHPAAGEAAIAAMAATGNPASIHHAGRTARRLLEDARESLAVTLRARPDDIVFTSGATEANALAIGALGHGRAILIGATEHAAVSAAAPDAVTIPVARCGRVDPEILRSLLEAHPGALVCLMAANNETGVLHDIAGAAALCARYGAALHVDAAQAAGRARQDWLALGAASFTISGHKAGGVMGAGALVLSPEHADGLRPLIAGGGQERGRRGGTPALPAIAGMAAALRQGYNPHIARYRDEIAAFCIEAGAVLIGADAPRLPNTLCLALPGRRADLQLIALDLAGIAVAAGAACASGRTTPSHVLPAMRLETLAGTAIRVSLPWNVTPAAVALFNAAYAALARPGTTGILPPGPTAASGSRILSTAGVR